MATEKEPKKRWLSEEEAELWAYVVRDATRLRRSRRKATAKSAGDSTANGVATAATAGITRDAAAPAQVKPATPAKTPSPTKTPSSRNQVPTPAIPSPSPAPSLASFDWRQARRLASGRDDIEARLDLHGRRQHEAYAALRSFLYSCRARGFRNVLVITGKGGRRAEETNGYHFGEERGVLRRLAPEWLRETEFREMVVSFTESHERHGGDGALYIKLRRMK